MDRTLERPTPNKVANRKLTFDDNVIKKIAGTVANDIDGILSMNGSFLSDFADRFRNNTDPTKGIDAEVGEKQVALDIETTLEYGSNAQTIFDELCTKVHQAIKSMTGLDLVELNLHVNDIMTKREWAQKNNEDDAKDRVS
ncbi:Asp23/Gls24 family envelope stress response protein [Agrilactobacillus fermenti]|uniref:Asp23/Gls24 family envelope stress response protein n=1 Tax=Agrilactobacillus fermenti TaxID=2586909 RepID=UPI001E36E4E0|nr:Asp23/Gls24 family envelope stress response protein [Agrilactobacillus fermenti]MCD2255636.1 Asp23/Gls24 family envelope stress response protein [Agrilactobacillus fermenti]